MIELFKLDHSLNFPAHELALTDPNGLLAFGGDLSPERLSFAYQNGIFPWFSEGEPILWWSPDPRGVIYTTKYKPSRSTQKSIRKYQYRASMNEAFVDVINACAKVTRHDLVEGNPNTTWITEEMMHAYIELHYSGLAHSVEIWNADEELVGGLYGIAFNSIFCGESMFHLQTDASKAALWALVKHMQGFNMPIIDCQMTNPHLISLGCKEMPRKEFLPLLRTLSTRQILDQNPWRKQSLAL